jgi:hypothetical protein
LIELLTVDQGKHCVTKEKQFKLMNNKNIKNAVACILKYIIFSLSDVRFAEVCKNALQNLSATRQKRGAKTRDWVPIHGGYYIRVCLKKNNAKRKITMICIADCFRRFVLQITVMLSFSLLLFIFNICKCFAKSDAMNF